MLKINEEYRKVYCNELKSPKSFYKYIFLYCENKILNV